MVMEDQGCPESRHLQHRQEHLRTTRKLAAAGLLGLALRGRIAVARHKVSFSERAKRVLSHPDEQELATRLRETRAAKHMLRLLDPSYGSYKQTAEDSPDDIIDSREAQRKTVSDFTPEEWAEAHKRTQEHLAQRQTELEEARALTPGMGCYGASNWPHLPQYPDWRENLPEDHPLRQIGPPLVVSGSPEHEAGISAFYRAMTLAIRQDTPNFDN